MSPRNHAGRSHGRHESTRAAHESARLAASARGNGEGDDAEGAPPERAPEVERGAPRPTARKAELALLAAGLAKDDPRCKLDDPLSELAALAETADLELVAERIVQKRERPDGATFVGKGTVARMGDVLAETGAGVVIFDNDLSPGQRRNLEKTLNKKVIDRTELILDIFARHARTTQARLQVEVAQLEYQLPRLRRLWSHLDPGVGMRGPGEKQLEIDKRLIKLRIQELKDALRTYRERKERELGTRRDVFTVALVGYTNVGKSTLMRRLTGADVYVADKLFATLDTRTRPWQVGPHRTVLLSDTVGFIRHLPHHLVESFHATLEEVLTADLLLHVVDASDPAPLEQVAAVREVLAALGVQEKAECVVLNKVDRATPDMLTFLEGKLGRATRVSAVTGAGIDALLARVNEAASGHEVEASVRLDVREGAAIATLEGQAEVLERELEGEDLRYRVRCRAHVLAAVRSRTRDPARLAIEEAPRPAAPAAADAARAGEATPGGEAEPGEPEDADGACIEDVPSASPSAG